MGIQIARTVSGDDATYTKANAVPSLDLRFATTKTLNDYITGSNLITFTRASTGTFVGSNGLIQTASTNTARFDHNPTTGESLGLLVEEQRTNFLLQSDSYDSGNASLSNVTVTANTVTAPDGTLTADSITGSSSTLNVKYAYKTYATTTTGTYTTSVFLKAGTQSLVMLRINDNGGVNDARQTFNLSSGTKSGSVAVGGTVTGASSDIIAFGNGWYRCSVTCNFVSALTSIQAASVFFDGYTTSTSTNTFYVWGAQLEAGAFPTSYIPTTTATVTRNADVASITGSNFSSWYRQDEGTVFAETQLQSTSARSAAGFDINDNSTNNRIVFRAFTSSSSDQVVIRSGATTVFSAANVTPAPTTANRKTSAGYKANDFAYTAIGQTGYTGTSGAVPVSPTQILIGYEQGPTGYLGGTIRRLTYWPSRLPNATLQSITS